MSAIKPSVKTRDFAPVLVLNTDYVVNSARPTSPIIRSTLSIRGMFNYYLNGVYEGNLSQEAARELFQQSQNYMTHLWTDGSGGNASTVEARVTSAASVMTGQYCHFIDDIFFVDDGQGGNVPKGYGIFYKNRTDFSLPHTAELIGGFRTSQSNIIEYSSSGLNQFFNSSGEAMDVYAAIFTFYWQEISENNKGYLFCVFKKRQTVPFDYMWGDTFDLHSCMITQISVTERFGVNNNLPTEGTDPNEEVSISDPEGNSQDVNSDILTQSDDIDLPDITMYPNSAAAGLVTLYAPSLTLMQSFADELWQDNVWETIFQYFGKPSDAIVGMGVLPFSPPTSGYKRPKIGIYTCTTALPVVSNQYHEIDCGSLAIEPVWDSYLDYSPYTRISIYLPYIGTRELDVDEIMGHSLFVKYRIDCYNGNLVAFVGIDGLSGPAVRYQFSGNCMQQLPVNAQSFDAMLAAGVQIATALVGGIAAGGAATASQGLGLANMAAGGASEMQLAQGAANMALGQARRDNALMQTSVGSVMSAKPRVEKNGAIGASIGQMSIQKPFITRIMPNQSLPENYMRYKGYPLNATSAIGDNPGFTVVDDVRLNNLPATIGELDEIYKLLGEGVIV